MPSLCYYIAKLLSHIYCKFWFMGDAPYSKYRVIVSVKWFITLVWGNIQHQYFEEMNDFVILRDQESSCLYQLSNAKYLWKYISLYFSFKFKTTVQKCRIFNRNIINIIIGVNLNFFLRRGYVKLPTTIPLGIKPTL